MTLLRVESLTANYGVIQALHNISFVVNEGEIVSLIGANGAGKSTTLMSISGINRETSGHVYLDGVDIRTLPPQEIVHKGIVQVPEGRRIFRMMTVAENLRMGYYVQRHKKNYELMLTRVLELFPRLEERFYQVADTLSGGEQQMLAIGRGLMADPRILLLDEPSLGLAPVIVEQVFDIIKQIRKQGVTVVLVEQNARMALKMSDHAYVLEVGNIALSGTGQELLASPKVQEVYLGGSYK